MATRLKINPPKRPDGDEPVTYTCEDCGDQVTVDPFIHAKVKHKQKDIIVDTRMINWYADHIREEVTNGKR